MDGYKVAQHDCLTVACGLHLGEEASVTVIHPQKIEGNWAAGIALDFHTTSSTPTGPNDSGHMQFHTIRPEISELLFRLKYRDDKSAVSGIVAGAVKFLTPHLANFDLIVPVPPSNQRLVQPVILLANGIGAALNKPVVNCVATTRPTAQLKNVDDPVARKAQVAGLYTVDPSHTRGRNILLFDDLYRSGTTMNAIADMLSVQGQAKSIRALTITKTRSNR